MGRCIDWPCCGHSENRCPEVKDNACVCGTALPPGHIDPLCKACFELWLDGGFPAMLFGRNPAVTDTLNVVSTN